MGDFLFNFVSKMDHPVALCFASFRIRSDIFKKLNRRVTREIVPLRAPSFWFHLGPKLPNVNDSSVPRVHSDEIVHPIYCFHSPTKFDWYCPPSLNVWVDDITYMGFWISRTVFLFFQVNIEMIEIWCNSNCYCIVPYLVFGNVIEQKLEEVLILLFKIGTGSPMKMIVTYGFEKRWCERQI